MENKSYGQAVKLALWGMAVMFGVGVLAAMR